MNDESQPQVVTDQHSFDHLMAQLLDLVDGHGKARSQAVSDRDSLPPIAPLSVILNPPL